MSRSVEAHRNAEIEDGSIVRLIMTVAILDAVFVKRQVTFTGGRMARQPISELSIVASIVCNIREEGLALIAFVSTTAQAKSLPSQA